MQISIPRMVFGRNRNFSNSRWRTDAIFKIVFGYISASYSPINAKFRMGDDESHADIGHVTKMEIFQIRDGGRPPFGKQFSLKVKVKVHTLDIAPLRSESPPQKRSGMTRILKGFHSFSCTPGTRSSAIGMSHTCLCLWCLRHSCNELMLSSVFQ